ncbi:murein hydrolase activator EnvC [Utexia brackfieldae]|uniref:murein hydrolase activator EnvC n=1 Tax=Utexia brackfieldae TaxID=3074108 RepID=UPI00370D479F
MQRLWVILFSGLMIGTISVPSHTYANSRDQLSTIQHSIAEQEKKLVQQRKERTALNAELKKQETAIARLLGSIQDTTEALSTFDQEITDLNQSISELERKQATQRQMLAKQLEGAFRLGKNSGIELVFNAKQSEINERMIMYFGYINQARQQQISQLKLTHSELASAKLSLQTKHAQQLALQQRQKQEQTSLEKNRQERKNTLAALDAAMQQGQQKLEDLRDNETKLQAELATAERNAREKTAQDARNAAQIRSRQQNTNYQPTQSEMALMARVSGIGKPQNRLNWPLAGSIVHHFGDAQQGELRWKGLVITGKEGAKIQAIADGRVILASWLQGYGFLVAIDHGKGDMSLYGYNQRVLVNVDDNVKSGQPIALVGNSGGQGIPALYFEIRRDGKALNPQAWLKR